MGYEDYAARAQGAGADGLLVVDLPPEEAAQLQPILAEHDLELVALVSPTTQAERMARICKSVTGFVYYVSIKGVTGGGGMDRGALGERLAQLRELTDRPIGVGFGISDAETAKAIGESADAVIIGSAIVKRIADKGADAAPELQQYLAEIRAALDEN